MSSARDSRRSLLDPASNEALAEKYAAVPYAAQSNALSHPNRLATVASLYGLSPASPTTCSVLEVGCSDGANLLPMAASLSAGTFVGCDLSSAAGAAGSSGSTTSTSPACVAFVKAFSAAPSGKRPLASPLARWQARRGGSITNLEHEALLIADALPGALLALLDGRHDRAALDAAVGPGLEVDDPGARRELIDEYVRQFAKLGLLIG